MDLTDRLVEHDLWLTERLIESASTLTDEQLDQPLNGNAVQEVSARTLRGLLSRMVFTKETWTASIKGRPSPEELDATIPGIRRRLEAIAPEFRRLVKDIKDRGDWDTAFVDALCDPPETFTFGGAIAHVVTFSAYRREMGIAALRTFGIKDIGYGDPIEWERAHANGNA